MKAPRLLSVDTLRGLTVGLMILVNDPGDPHCVYRPLRHAEWNGCTLADLVFPNFLFLGGVSSALSLASPRAMAERGERGRLLGRRAANLILLELFLTAMPGFRLRRVRLFGVLRRTALCSLATGVALLAGARERALPLLAAGLLLDYAAVLELPWTRGDGGRFNTPPLDPDNNPGAALDRAIARRLHGGLHAGALYNVTHDPEGLLSTLPAIATTLLGAWAGLLLRRREPSQRTTLKLGAAGLLCLALGAAWSRRLPLNKNLWTSSYALYSAGWSLLALAGAHAVLDGGDETALAVRTSLPARILGSNALAVYALSVAGHKMLRVVHRPWRGHSVSLRTLLYQAVFARRRSSPARSLGFAAAYAGVCFGVALGLWRRRIVLKF